MSGQNLAFEMVCNPNLSKDIVFPWLLFLSLDSVYSGVCHFKVCHFVVFWLVWSFELHETRMVLYFTWFENIFEQVTRGFTKNS